MSSRVSDPAATNGQPTTGTLRWLCSDRGTVKSHRKTEGLWDNAYKCVKAGGETVDAATRDLCDTLAGKTAEW